MITVLMLAPGYPHQNHDSIFIKHFIDELCKYDLSITLIAPVSITKGIINKTKLPPRLVINNNLKIIRPRYVSFSNLRLLGVHVSNLMFNISLIFWGIREKHDVVISHFLTQALSGHILSKNRLLFFSLGEDKIRINEMYPNFILRRILSNTTGIISLSNRNLFDAKNLPFPKNMRHIILPNAYNPHLFYPIKREHSKYGFLEDDLIIGFVGSDEPRKGLNYLIDALNYINTNNIKLLVIGRVTRQIEFNKSNVIFLGVVPQNVVADTLSLVDVFCHPSSSEGSSNAIIEAMACGKPIIASEDKFNDDILRESFAFRINVTSKEEIVQTLKFCMSNKEKLVEMGQAAFEFIKDNTIESRVRKVLDFIQINSDKYY